MMGNLNIEWERMRLHPHENQFIMRLHPDKMDSRVQMLGKGRWEFMPHMEVYNYYGLVKSYNLKAPE